MEHGGLLNGALHQSRERFKDLFDNAPMGYHEVDATGRLVHINQTELKMLGYTADELLGQFVWKISAQEEVSREAVHAKLSGEPPPPSFEFMLRRKDGTTFLALIEDRMIKSAGGGIIGIRSVVQNIAERKWTMDLLNTSRMEINNLKAAMDQHSIVATTDPQGRITYVNDKFCTVSKYRRDELLGQDHRIVNSGHHPKEFMRGLWATIGRGEIWKGEIKNRAKDGSFYWVDATIMPFLNAEGKPYQYVAIRTDITARKRAEEALTLFRRLMDQSGEIVEVIDPETGRILDMNEEACQATGYTRTEYLQLTVFDFNPLLQRDLFKANQERMRRSGPITLIASHRRKDGEPIPTEVKLSLVRLDRDYLVAIIRDITDRKQAEVALQESEKRFRSLFENMLNGFAYCRMLYDGERPTDFVYLAVNRAFESLTGLKNVMGRKVSEVIPGIRDSDPELWEKYARVVRTGEPEKFEIYVEALKIWFAISVYRPEPDHFVAVFDVITERKRAENALRESEERFRQVVENIREVFWMTDPTMEKMLYVSPSYEEVWGRTRESLYQSPRTWLEAIHPEDQGRMLVASKKPMAGVTYDEVHRILRPDGSTRWVRDRGYPIRDAAGQVFRIVGTAEDITSQKEMEVQVMRMQRMESIGRMAGGIAHDLNNILAPILMGAPLLRMNLPPEQAEKMLTSIETSAQRGADLVKHLLMFGRGVEGRRTVIRLKDLMREMEDITRQTFPRSIAIAAKIPADLWPVLGDITQLHQVLLNLCVNARDAMPDGGTLDMAAKNVRIDESYASMSPDSRPGDYVCLSVTDTGTGIAPEIIDKIFDPFFTTKAVGKGTGLGLSTLLGIVKSHVGFVTVQSEVGRGSGFHVYLPAVPEATAATSAGNAGELPRGHGETILVVEDESSIREITGKILTQYGYRVLSSADGADGCALFARHLSEIDVVLTDIDMPIMGGVEMIKVLKRMKPGIKVIVSSGKGSGIIDKKTTPAERGALQVNSYLAKPYSAERILELLHGLITNTPVKSDGGNTSSPFSG